MTEPESSATVKMTESIRSLGRRFNRIEEAHEGTSSGRFPDEAPRARVSWSQILVLLVPLLAGSGGSAAVTIAVTGARLDQISNTLAEVRLAQQSNSFDVIALRKDIESIEKDLERLREASVSAERLATETVAREAGEKRMLDLYQTKNAIVTKNAARIETLRTLHNNKELNP